MDFTLEYHSRHGSYWAVVSKHATFEDAYDAMDDAKLEDERASDERFRYRIREDRIVYEDDAIV